MSNSTISLLTQVSVMAGFVIGGLYLGLKKVGVIKQTQPSIEPRAEQMWRSEAEAQSARANRLEDELKGLSIKLDAALAEIVTLKQEIRVLHSRPDYGQMLSRFDEHHQAMLATSSQFAVTMTHLVQTLDRIAVAVIPEDIMDN